MTKEGIEYNLIMVGDGEEYNKIQSLIKKIQFRRKYIVSGTPRKPI
ncbi:Uncharacterised protein [[Clostridium] sordellii]|nr:Uncharacterised protein [[Clostridium] sordellii] [Paeniclostridium sordellii]